MTAGDAGRGSAPDDRIVVWAVAGGLGPDSLNRRLLRAIAALAPSDITVEICELLPDVPLFDEELVGAVPPVVAELRAEISAADAILVATNDLNGGIPGILKNALDWLSVPEGRAATRGRPVALAGAFPEEVATVRAHADLRSIFTSLEALVLPPPWLLLDRAGRRIGEGERRADADLEAQIEQLFRRLRHAVRGTRRGLGIQGGLGEPDVLRRRSLSHALPRDPSEHEGVGARSRQRREVLEFLQANLHRTGLDVAQIARACRMSPRTLQRLFNHAETTLGSPATASTRGVMNALRALRVEHAARLLRTQPSRSVRAILRASGFSSASTFHRAFREFTGMTPSEYRQQWTAPGDDLW